MITRIDAINYRCFEKMSVPFRDFCIIAGANGSGKTTLLDIPVLLGDLLRGRHVATAFMDRLWGRGARASSLNELTYRGQGGSFALGVEARLPDALVAALVDASSPATQQDPTRWPDRIRYEIQLAIEEEHQLVVRNEFLFVFPHSAIYGKESTLMEEDWGEQEERRFILKRESPSKEVSKVFFRSEKKDAKEQESHIDQTVAAFPRLQYESKADFQAGRWLLDRLLGGVVFFDPEWRELRKASPPGLPKELMATGENLPWLALQLQKQDPQRFADWIDHIKTALPQISSISAREREEDHHAYFRVEYEGGFAVTSSGLSEGTSRILALTLLAYLEDIPRLLVIEEPENSIHPQAIEVIMQSLRSLYDQQVWVSTHSPIVLSGAQVDELRIMRLDRAGAATVTCGREHPRLARWKGAIDLGSLFATGVFE